MLTEKLLAILSFQVEGDNDHAGKESFQRIGEWQVTINEKLVGKALAQLNFRRKNEVRIIEFKADTYFVPEI